MTWPGLQPATAAPPQDPGHLLPVEDWQRVVREAEQEAERIARGGPSQDLLSTARWTTGLPVPTSGAVVARSNGGRRPRGWPSFGVLHDAETPLRAGFAASIARYLAGSGVSAHYMVDPAETWGVLPDELVAYHVGGANLNSLGVEQAGYASFTPAQWLTAEGLAQMARVAVLMRAAHARYGIGLFWNTDAQLRDAHAGRIVAGWSTHDDCRRVIGGTTHTDPGTAYPRQQLMALAVQGTQPAPPATTEEEDMARLIRNAKGTVVELAPTYAEWVPTAADHKAATAQLGAVQTYTDAFFDALIRRARAAGTPATRATVGVAGALLDAGADPDDPATWPPTPEADE